MFKRVVVDRFYKYLIPMFLTAFALQLSDFMDSLVVSNLLNSDALAVLNMGGAFNSVISALFSMFGIGGSICYAKYQGVADKATARKYYSAAIFCAIISSLTVVLACNMYPDVLSNMLCKSAELRPMFDSYINYQIVAAPFMCVIMTAVSFLPAAGHPIESMIFNIGFNVSNILLDIVFVKYCHMGVSGAAFATAVSLILWAIGLSLWLWFKKTQLRFKIKGVFDLKVILEIISFGFAIALSQVGFSIKIAYSNAMLNELFGKQGIVTFSICMQIISIMSVFLSGMLRTVTPLVSMLNGQRDYVGVRQTIRRGMIILGVTSFVVLSLIYCFPGMVLRAYNAYNPATLEIAITEIRIFIIALLFRSLYMLYMSYVNAMGRKKYSLFISMFDGFVGILLFARPMVALMGPFGFWWAYPVVSIVLCIFIVIINIIIALANKGKLEPFFLTNRVKNEVFRFTYDRNDINSLSRASENAMAFVREKGFSNKTCTAVGLLMEESPRYIMNRTTHTKLMDAIVTCLGNTVEIGYRFVGKPYNEVWFANSKDEANERILARYIKDFDFSYVMGINNIRVTVAGEDLGNEKESIDN